MDFEGFEQGFSSTKNGRVSYLRRKSAGKPIIFLHGIGGSLKSWNKLAPFLPKGLDLYLIDLLGHGRSDAPDIEYDVMMQVEMLEELVENLGLTEPTIFGHSYGGWMAIHYSLRQKTAGLMIEDSAGMESQQQEIQKTGESEEYKKELVSDAMMIGANEKVMRSAAANFSRYTLTKDILSKVSARTFLIWGDNDDFVPIKFGKEMHEMIKDSDFLVIPGAGHVPHRTKPEIVAAAISRFCRATTPGG
jgi:pimeloyl-ACP methyl ester carboxylesterase